MQFQQLKHLWCQLQHLNFLKMATFNETVIAQNHAIIRLLAQDKPMNLETRNAVDRATNLALAWGEST